MVMESITGLREATTKVSSKMDFGKVMGSGRRELVIVISMKETIFMTRSKGMEFTLGN